MPPLNGGSRKSTNETNTSSSRQDSWSSTAATRGDAPSRSSSWAVSSPILSEGDEEAASDVIGDVPSIRINARPGSTPGAPPHARLPSSPLGPPDISSASASAHDPNNAHVDEAADTLSPLASRIGSSSNASKKVHFTPSVVGGLSSIASSSPPPSPGGGPSPSISGTLGSRVPLPPSDEEDEGPEDQFIPSEHVVPPTPVDDTPMEEYRVPQATSPGTGTSHTPTPARTSPPRLPSVPLAPNASSHGHPHGHSRSGSAGGGLSLPHDQAGSPGSMSPRLRATIVPPISATHLLPSVPTTGAGGSHSSSGSGSTSMPILPSTPPEFAPGRTPPYRAGARNGNGNGNGLPIPPPGPPPSPPTPLPLPDVLEPEESNRAKKHAKYAISALDYDDLDTARKELIGALRVLGVVVQL